MSEVKEVTLQTGRTLKIYPSPFDEAQALYEAIFEEAKTVRFVAEDNVINFFKDCFVTAFSSKKVKPALKKCMERCLYEGNKITRETWEPLEAREDYFEVCWEVAKENCLPFTKSLYAKFSPMLQTIMQDLVSEPTKTPL